MEGKKECTNTWCNALMIMAGHGPVEIRDFAGVVTFRWNDLTRDDTFVGSGETPHQALEQLHERARVIWPHPPRR